MNTVFALQHTESEFLGLLEDHLEGRGIRFQYLRPFINGALPSGPANAAGLVLLGGGPWGTVSAPILPSLTREVALTRGFLDLGRPVIGFGLGAQILCLAAGGGVEAGPLTFEVFEARRVAEDALGGFLPPSWPMAVYMRDRPIPPPGAEVLAQDPGGRPALFAVRSHSFGFLGHPGVKPGMIEDLIMEFSDSPEDCGPALEALRRAGSQIHASLTALVTGLIQATGWMSGALPPRP